MTDREKLLRYTLRANAAFSAFCGFDMALFSGIWSEWVGVEPASIFTVLGVSLVVYAVFLLLSSRRRPLRLGEAWFYVAGDLAWVLGSVALIVAGPLSQTGNVITGILAAVVFAFAEAQILGIRRIRRADAEEVGEPAHA